MNWPLDSSKGFLEKEIQYLLNQVGFQINLPSLVCKGGTSLPVLQLAVLSLPWLSIVSLMKEGKREEGGREREREKEKLEIIILSKINQTQ
jgi:hypothetical protein